MLAYSAIAHAGYALVGVAAGSPQGMEGAVVYFAAYGAGAVGAFLVVAALAREGVDDRIAGLAGLGRSRPLLAAALTGMAFGWLHGKQQKKKKRKRGMKKKRRLDPARAAGNFPNAILTCRHLKSEEWKQVLWRLLLCVFIESKENPYYRIKE